MPDEEMKKQVASANPVALQRELFALLDNLFTIVAGAPAHYFPTWDDAIRVTKARARNGAVSKGDAEAAHRKVVEFYNLNAQLLFLLAKQMAGIRLVLGGGNNYFFGDHLSSVQKMLLYADTVLIPDPVFERIERCAKLEKFDRVQEIHSAYFLLKLKPLVDVDLPYQALFVFPSFEKTLEDNDKITQGGISRLFATVMSHQLGANLASMEDVFAFAEQNRDAFLAAVKEKSLFVAPGQHDPATPLEKSIELYREYIKTWRTQEVAEIILRLPDNLLVANGIMERISPQYHLIENSEELQAHPLLPLAVRGHYFNLCARAYAGRVEQLGHLSADAKSNIQALNESNLAWLGNVPIKEIARLRVNNENEEFRRSLDSAVRALNSATLEDSGKVAGEVAKQLAGMIASHQTRIREIEEAYQKQYKQLAVPSILTAAAAFVPAIAPILGISVGVAAALGIAAKYAKDKHDEQYDKGQQSRSLLGVLAAAKRGKI